MQVNAVETDFAYLECSEKECAITFLETLVNKLKCLLKVKELVSNKQKQAEEENNNMSTETITKSRKRRLTRTCSQISKQKAKITESSLKVKDEKIKEDDVSIKNSNTRTRLRQNKLEENNPASENIRRSSRTSKKKVRHFYSVAQWYSVWV